MFCRVLLSSLVRSSLYFFCDHLFFLFFFFNDTATTEIYTLSLHDALPIFDDRSVDEEDGRSLVAGPIPALRAVRSEEHTSELQSLTNLVCRLLLEKKKKNKKREKTKKSKETIQKNKSRTTVQKITQQL